MQLAPVLRQDLHVLTQVLQILALNLERARQPGRAYFQLIVLAAFLARKLGVHALGQLGAEVYVNSLVRVYLHHKSVTRLLAYVYQVIVRIRKPSGYIARQFFYLHIEVVYTNLRNRNKLRNHLF